MALEIKILNQAVEIPDNPSDCALVVALPLDQETFLRELREGPDENFARSFRAAGRTNLPDSTVFVIYKKYADLALDVISEVTQRGVTVARDAQLHHFSSAVRSFRVVTLLAHTRDSLFYESDIVDPDLVYNALSRKGSRLSQTIQRLLGDRPLSIPSPAPAGRKRLVNFLNEVLRDSPTDNNGGSFAAGRPGDLTRTQCKWASNRSAIETALPNAFGGGSAIQFSNGFAILSSVLNEIPEEFSGKLDLTCCHSTVFAENVRRKCRSGFILANEQSTSVDLRLAIYRQLVRSLSRRPEPYEDAMFRIRKELIPSTHA